MLSTNKNNLRGLSTTTVVPEGTPIAAVEAEFEAAEALKTNVAVNTSNHSCITTMTSGNYGGFFGMKAPNSFFSLRSCSVNDGAASASEDEDDSIYHDAEHSLSTKV